MSDLGYAAAVFPDTIFFTSDSWNEEFIVTREDDGSEVFDKVQGMIEREAPASDLIAYLNQIPTMKLV